MYLKQFHIFMHSGIIQKVKTSEIKTRREIHFLGGKTHL